MDPDLLVRSVKTWEVGVVPSLAMEIVSDDVDKDYVDGPIKYAEMGVRELVVHDPEPQRGADRIRWQVYRRRGADPRAPGEYASCVGCFAKRSDITATRTARGVRALAGDRPASCAASRCSELPMGTGACVRSSNLRSSISLSFRRCSIAHRGIREPLINSNSLCLFAAHAVEALYAGPTRLPPTRPTTAQWRRYSRVFPTISGCNRR